MPDLENVMAELKEGIEFAYHRCHCGLAVTMENALSLLKQQEPIPPKWKKLRGYASPFCAQCGSSLPEAIKPNYCQHCGKAVKWDE